MVGISKIKRKALYFLKFLSHKIQLKRGLCGFSFKSLLFIWISTIRLVFHCSSLLSIFTIQQHNKSLILLLWSLEARNFKLSVISWDVIEIFRKRNFNPLQIITVCLSFLLNPSLSPFCDKQSNKKIPLPALVSI